MNFLERTTKNVSSKEGGFLDFPRPWLTVNLP